MIAIEWNYILITKLLIVVTKFTKSMIDYN